MAPDLEVLGQRLAALGRSGLGLHEARRRQRARGGEDSAEGLLEFLLAEGQIDALTFAMLASAATVRVTDRLPARLALLRAVQAGDAGHVETRAFGSLDLLAFDRISPLGWVLVAVIDEDVLFAGLPEVSGTRTGSLAGGPGPL